MPRPLLLGHRGARGRRLVAENTLAAFDYALAEGCDGFEFDVRLTADGKAVVCHDPEVDGIEIADACAEQVTALPKLQDVLARYQSMTFLDIELKVGGLEKACAALLRKHPPRSGFVVSSFLPEVLEALRGESKTVPLGLICETKAQLHNWTELSVEYVIPHYRLATRAVICELKAASKKILVWTVNDPADMKRFAESGVDGIIGDDPGLLCRSLISSSPE